MIRSRSVKPSSSRSVSQTPRRDNFRATPSALTFTHVTSSALWRPTVTLPARFSSSHNTNDGHELHSSKLLVHAFEKQRAMQSLAPKAPEPNMLLTTIFPTLEVVTIEGNTVTLKSLIKDDTIFVVQPGISHPAQWEGKEDALNAWKAIQGVPGCTAQTLKYNALFEKFSGKGYNVVIVVGNKTPQQMHDTVIKNKLKFPIVCLTQDSLHKLLAIGLGFKFKDQALYPKRFTMSMGHGYIYEIPQVNTTQPGEEPDETLASLLPGSCNIAKLKI